MRRSGGALRIVIPVILGVPVFLSAQDRVAQRDAPRPASPEVRARRAVKFLELPARRTAAINELVRLGEASVPALRTALRDPRPEIVLHACRVIGSLGGAAKPLLPQLEALAKSEDAVRARAAKWARHRIRPAGITLVAEYSAGKVTEIDANGKARVVAKLPGAFDAEWLPNGHYLVVQYHHNKVVEVDAKGKVVWSYAKLAQPLDADRLANGNTLIVERAGGARVIEVAKDGKIVWEFKDKKGRVPQHADRLPSGNTLVAFFKAGQVVEVDPKGNILWVLSDLSRVSDVDKLANGNLLLTIHDKKMVREITSEGETVMEIQLADRASDAYRLPNGHTLVATNTAVIEYDTKGKKVWERRAGYAGSVTRYGARALR